MGLPIGLDIIQSTKYKYLFLVFFNEKSLTADHGTGALYKNIKSYDCFFSFPSRSSISFSFALTICR
jgi:hypothetical protein